MYKKVNKIKQYEKDETHIIKHISL